MARIPLLLIGGCALTLVGCKGPDDPDRDTGTSAPPVEICPVSPCAEEVATTIWRHTVEDMRLGAAIAGGDLRDGIPGAVMGAPGTDDYSRGNEVFVRPVEPGLGEVVLETADVMATRWGNFGSAVAPLRDVDGDGLPDLWIGAGDRFGTRGGGYLVPGSTPLPADDVDQDAALLFTFEDRAANVGRYTGYGDLDGNGQVELLVGADWHTLEGPGRLYGLDPATRGVTSEASLEIVGRADVDADGFGNSVLVADMNGDGVDDLIAGAPWWPPSADIFTSVDLGGIWYAEGPMAGSLSVEGVGTYTAGVHDDAFFGALLAFAEDLDGDGARELFTADYRSRVYLFSREALAAGDFAAGEVLFDHNTTLRAVGGGAAFGDFTGDATPDVALGWMDYEYQQAYVGVLQGPFEGRQDVDQLVGVVGGGHEGDQFGSKVVATDADGDERSDLIVGAMKSSVVAEEAGAVYLILGADLPL